MSDSREESPDWLRSFQAPSHSVVSVSSDSELSPSKSPINEHDFDTQLVSANKKSDEFDGEKEDDQEQPLSKRAGRSSSIKTPAKNTPKKRPKRVEDSTPSKRTKTGNDKRRGNKSNKVSKEKSSDVQVETDVLKHSVWTLSSDGEEKDDAALISSRILSPAKCAARRKSTELKQNKADHLPVNKKTVNAAKEPEEDEELSSHESSEFKESEEEDDEALSGSRRQPASKGKTLRKNLKRTDNTIPRKKKMNDVKLPEEDEDLSPHESFESQDGGETDDEAPIGSRRQPTPIVARKEKSLKKKPEAMAKPSASIFEVKKERDASTEQSGPRVQQKEKPKEKIKNESDDLAVDKTKVNTSVKNEGVSDTDITAQGNSEKQLESHVNSSKLPLVLPEKVQRTVALVECEADSIDVSGDMGAVGRVIISDNPSRDKEMLLDLKGTIYRTSIVPSRTFCIVTMGQSEAKIDAIMNDFIQLRPQSNVYDAETMVEGTLDGFSFDSEDEADKSKAAARQNDQGEDAEEQAGKKTKGKSGKKQGVAQKKGKAVATKQPRKRKSAPKKVKGKK